MAPWQWWSDSAGPGSRKGTTGECGIVLGGRAGVDYVRSDMRAQRDGGGRDLGVFLARLANFGSHGSDEAMTTLFLPLRIRLPIPAPPIRLAVLYCIVLVVSFSTAFVPSTHLSIMPGL
jgi:hypothetical protein